jgi:type II secretory pathway pseudopilin PulG
MPKSLWAPARGRRETGSTLIEIVVSVALLAVFSTATVLAVTKGTATSSENRARVGAASLAQRELEYVSQVIAGSGTAELRKAPTVVNPNLSEELKAAKPSGDFKFRLDGTLYRVERKVANWFASQGSACDDSTIGKTPVIGTLVTVSVTWDGMENATKPHVASKVFPPKKDETLALEKGTSLLAVQVDGAAGTDGTAREGVKVEISGGPVISSPVSATNAKGCTLFQVKPAATGTVYHVQLMGGPGGTWISPSREVQPVTDTELVMPDTNVPIPLQYDRAAKLSVLVTGARESEYVTLTPADISLGLPRQEPIDEAGVSEFLNVYPGFYTAKLRDATASLELTSGENGSTTLEPTP